MASVLALATLFGLAAALVAGSATSAERDSRSTFLTKALGRPLGASPTNRIVRGLETRVDRRSYTVASKSASVSLASEGVGDREWRAFENGFSRQVPFGRETIIAEPRTTEQFFTVEKAQGLRTWRWSLSSPGLRPKLTRDGAVVFSSGNRLADLMVLPAAIFDSGGRDITPTGLRWSLVRDRSAWSLRLRLDDSRLPVPYVIDPAITFRAAASGQNNNATTLVILKPTGVVAGDFLIAQVTVRGGSSTTITAPLGWTELGTKTNNGTTIGQAVYWKFAGASEPASYTWTFNGPRNASGGIIAYTGVNTTTPIDAFGSQPGGPGTAVTAPSITTTVDDTMLVGFFGTAHFTTFTPPAGMTERYDDRSQGNMQADRTTSEGADVVQASAGPTGTKTATAGQSALWVAHLVALKPAAAVRTTATTVSCTPASVAVAQPTTCTATVSDNDSGTPSRPSGTVTFTLDADPDGDAGAFTPVSCVLPASGPNECSVTYTPTAIGDGIHRVRATYGGDATHSGSSGTFDVTVTARTTTTTVSCTPATVALAQPTTCTATVADSSPGTPSRPSGTVTFTLDADPDGDAGAFTPVSCVLPASGPNECSVTYTATAIGDGTHTIRATYGGDATHTGSSGTFDLSVTARATTTSVSCTPASVALAEPTTCTATVSDSSPGTPTRPSGTVTFTLDPDPDGDAGAFTPPTCTLPPTGPNQCSVTYTPTAVGDGTHTIRATYGGDATHTGSSGTFDLSVTARATTTSVSCTPASVALAQPTTCTATVTDSSPGTPSRPSGTVTFTLDPDPDGDSGAFTPVSCVLPLTGPNQCSVTYTPAAVGDGTHTIRATYSGDATHTGSSGTFDLSVTARATTTSVSCTPASVALAQPTTCTATVTDSSPGTPSRPSGTVTFSLVADPDGDAGAFTPVSCVLPLAGPNQCSVTYTPAAVGDGTHTIRADYSGDATHTGSFGTFDLTVTARATTTSVSCTPASVALAQPTTCTATVTDSSPGTPSRPSGTVTFTLDPDPDGDSGAFTPVSCVLPPTGPNQCSVTYTPTAVGDGTHTVRATYSGDVTHAGSSGTFDLTVTTRATTTTLTCDTPVAIAQPSECTAVVEDIAAGDGSDPAGTVSFSRSGAGSGTFSSPSCVLVPDPSAADRSSCSVFYTPTSGAGSGTFSSPSCVLVPDPSAADRSSCSVFYTPTSGAGTHTIRADYSGSPVHTASFDTFDITVTLRATTTTLTCTPATVAVDSPTTCTATVSDSSQGTATRPSGVVTFSLVVDPDGDAGSFTPPACVLPVTGPNECSVTYTPATVGDGIHTIRADYSGDATHETSFDTFDLTVTLRSTTTTVACTPASPEAGQPTTCTATVTDTEATGTKSPPTGMVSWTTSGSGSFAPTNQCTLAPSGLAQSSCSVVYSSEVAGTDTITATYGGDAKHEGSSGSTTVIVRPGPPAIVTVDPPGATNDVNTTHCVRARVTDEFGNPTPGVMVFFTVTGSNSASGSSTTGPDGWTGQFCYLGRLFGLDTIRAVADRNGNGQPDTGEPAGIGTKVWLLPEPPLPCDVLITQGGWIIAANGDRGSFGGNAHASTEGDVYGQENYQDHGPMRPMHVHSINVLTVLCSANGTRATIFGEATIDGAGRYPYRIDVQDIGEPGVGQDTYGILLPGYDSGEQVLMGGNVQIHLL